MLLSLNWLRDFVDLPADLDVRDFAERFTRTTAEVDGLHPITVNAKGLLAARIEKLAALPDTRKLHCATLNVGGKSVEVVTAASGIKVGDLVVYAPVGASVESFGKLKESKVAGRTSCGMILPGESIGIEMATQEAIFLPPDVKPGDALAPELFDDWLLDIDNKSLTNRPDLWGHYGVAREVAAIYRADLKQYVVTDLGEFAPSSLREIPIDIAAPDACPRYSGLMIARVPTQPAPLWMQLRLGHVGLRPISGLVDLTNYVMFDLGQPMHAFDAGHVDRIEVDWANKSERFFTLDGAERKLTASDLMIKCDGKSVALAGVMGGQATEVTDKTAELVLESANFDAATIRKTAIRLGLRTDASARFEKSLDPTNTTIAIGRFVELAKSMYPKMKAASRLSDGFPAPPSALAVSVNPRQVATTIGREVTFEQASEKLCPLGFTPSKRNDHWDVGVPSFRATGDVGIEADIIEEIARCIGYDHIEPAMPRVTMRRFEPNALHQLENNALRYFTTAHEFHEIHGYLWYDGSWLNRLGVKVGKSVELANAAADGLHQLRHTLMPGMLSAVERNRFYFPSFSLIELGSVFETGSGDDAEHRNIGLISAARGKSLDGELVGQVKAAIEGWMWSCFGRPVEYRPVAANPDRPWEYGDQTVELLVGDHSFGRLSVVDAGFRRAMDEHLAAWSIAWAELRLSGLETLTVQTEKLGVIPSHPLVEMDFSIVVNRTTSYAEVAQKLAAFEHDLLQSIRYIGEFEGGSLKADQRSLTFRLVIGGDGRTLVDDDSTAFRRAFEQYLDTCGYTVRK